MEPRPEILSAPSRHHAPLVPSDLQPSWTNDMNLCGVEEAMDAYYRGKLVAIILACIKRKYIIPIANFIAYRGQRLQAPPLSEAAVLSGAGFLRCA